MLIVYSKLTKAYVWKSETNSDFPNGVPLDLELERNVIPNLGGSKDDYGGISIRDTDPLVGKLFAAASFEVVFDADGSPLPVPDCIRTYARIAVTADKDRIQADGVDKATITAEVPDPANADPIRFFVDGQEVGQAVPVDGRAVLEFTAADPGRYRIEAESLAPGPPGFDLKFGRNGLRVEAVV
jgi:hypothetical protein